MPPSFPLPPDFSMPPPFMNVVPPQLQDGINDSYKSPAGINLQVPSVSGANAPNSDSFNQSAPMINSWNTEGYFFSFSLVMNN